MFNYNYPCCANSMALALSGKLEDIGVGVVSLIQVAHYQCFLELSNGRI